MIILRSKLYTDPSQISSSSLDKTTTTINSGPIGSGSVGTDINTAPDLKMSSSDKRVTVGDVRSEMIKMNQLTRSMDTKSYSDTPMGINYVGQAKPINKRKKSSLIAKGLRKTTKPILRKSENILQDLPMSQESKIKQGRKLKAIKFYLDRGTRGLDRVAEKVYSEERMPVSPADMRKAETDGVVQRRPDGKWGIIAKKKRLWWSAGYDSRESAEAALRAYHAGRH